jgi:hypothetical protein
MNTVCNKRLSWFAGSLILVMVSFPLASSAQLEVNGAIGGQFGGDINFDPPDRDFEADGGFTLKVGADYFTNELLGVGGYLSFGEGEIQGLDLSYFEIGIAIKPRLTREDFIEDYDLLITPGLYVGYRVESVDGAPGDDSGDGLALNLGIDIRLRFENNYAIFIEPGFITQPDGGSDDADVTFSPIGVFLVGVAYTF